jgi:hypothetical protein
MPTTKPTSKEECLTKNVAYRAKLTIKSGVPTKLTIN